MQQNFSEAAIASPLVADRVSLVPPRHREAPGRGAQKTWTSKERLNRWQAVATRGLQLAWAGALRWSDLNCKGDRTFLCQAGPYRFESSLLVVLLLQPQMRLLAQHVLETGQTGERLCGTTRRFVFRLFPPLRPRHPLVSISFPPAVVSSCPSRGRPCPILSVL
jgi:hypothetical protein